jgi:hypothetical protein
MQLLSLFTKMRFVTQTIVFTYLFVVSSALAHRGALSPTLDHQIVRITAKNKNISIRYVAMLSPVSAEKWRTRFDADHDRRLNPEEQKRLSENLKSHVQNAVELVVDGDRQALSFTKPQIGFDGIDTKAKSLSIGLSAELPIQGGEHLIHLSDRTTWQHPGDWLVQVDTKEQAELKDITGPNKEGKSTVIVHFDEHTKFTKEAKLRILVPGSRKRSLFPWLVLVVAVASVTLTIVQRRKAQFKANKLETCLTFDNSWG